MISEDYFKRTIRQLVEAFARIIGLSKSGRNELAEAQLAQLYVDQLGMTRDTFAQLAPESLVQILGTRVQVAVELLRGEAELRMAQGQVGDARELLALAERLKG